MKAIRVPLIFLCLTFSLKSFAILEFNDGVFPEFATSARALAMGNAFISKVDDSSAAFYNPAGLGTIRKTHFHLSNFHIETNKDAMNIATGGKLSDAVSNFSDSFSLDGTRKLLLENTGKLYYSRFHFLPNFTTRYFTAGYLVSRQTRATIGTNAGALFEYSKRTDHGPYVGLNLSLFGGIIKFGATGLLLKRSEVKDEADPNLTVDLQDGDYQKGTAFIVTAGTKLTLPWTYLPTFSAVLRNAGDQTFTGRAAGAPDKVPNAIDVGFSITPQIGRIVRVHFEANYRDIGSETSASATRKIGLGMEIDIARKLFFRFGYGDGFGSGGIGIRTQKVEFDFTSYAVDTTSSEYRGKEDRRFALSISTGF